MKTCEKGIALICHFESLHDGDLTRIGAQPKMDPVGIWTVGYGHALRNPVTGKWYKGEKDKKIVYKMYPALSETQARVLLNTDLPIYENAVNRMIKRRDLLSTQNSALVAFAFNCGTHYINSFNIRKPYKIWSMVDAGASKEVMFNYWCTSVIKSEGKVLPGLIRRRKSEANLYTTGMLNFYN